MEELVKKEIPILNNAREVRHIQKGFSHDKKYILDDQYLLRIFSSENVEQRHQEFKTIKKLANYSEYVPNAIEFNTIKEYSYMILTYLAGEDAEETLKSLTEAEQYDAGLMAGKELRKMHKLQAPARIPSWYSQKKKKSDNYLNALKEIPIDEEIRQMLTVYIQENDHLMKYRPNTFQHDDFHPANLIINNRKFAGIIDFQRIDWGDPLHDLTKLGFFSVRTSVPFSIAVIDGYFSPQKPNNEFWQLYSLYSAMHVVSSYVWGFRLGEDHFKRLYTYSADVIADHINFTKAKPSWY